MKNLLSIESLSREEILTIVERAKKWKQERGRHVEKPLSGQVWALLFSKSSTRTRVSFETGIRELGGSVMFLAADDIQLGRGEPIRDTARVLGRMIHGAVIRTFQQQDVMEFAEFSGIPTINALTDEEHPCQILADLFTIKERLGNIEDFRICFLGDGDCNVAHSWIWAAARLGFSLRIAAPCAYQPSPDLLRAAGARITVTEDLQAAVKDCQVLYTDVWVSMGKEQEAANRLVQFAKYQINKDLVRNAAPGALVMHCLPAYRGKEITEEIFEAHAEIIFSQAENRLHIQKAILEAVISGRM